MDALTFRNELRAVTRSIGVKASINVLIWDHGEAPLIAFVYPTGHSKEREFTVEGHDFEGLLAGIKVKWAEHEAIHHKRTVRQMALAIIRITAELGECTDAALRNCGEFDPGQVRRCGDEACADANEVAGRGPFTILVKGGANAPRAEVA